VSAKQSDHGRGCDNAHKLSRSRSGRGARRKQSKGSSSSSSSRGKRKKDKKASEDDSDTGTDDDDIIHFDWKKDMVLNSKYSLLKLLGDGTFGRVVLARDRDSNRDVAIKIIRDVERYMDNAKIEADILKDIRKADPRGTSGCAIMYETFVHESKFFCLVFEPLGTSLYDFLKDNEYRGYWMQDIQHFAKQSMQALAFLHDSLRMTHTDLKPENVLLCTMDARESRFPREAEWMREQKMSAKELKPYMRPVSSDIKIIDFGNATYDDEQHSSTINTRQYRGPEVMLSCGWDTLSDQWSIGCILMELYSGNLLFETHEEMEHLALIERIIGPLPGSILESASSSALKKWFTQQGGGRWRLNWPDNSSSMSSERHVASQRPLNKQVPTMHAGLTDFVAELLELAPGKRKTASSMLKHPFLTEMIYDD